MVIWCKRKAARCVYRESMCSRPSLECLIELLSPAYADDGPANVGSLPDPG